MRFERRGRWKFICLEADAGLPIEGGKLDPIEGGSQEQQSVEAAAELLMRAIQGVRQVHGGRQVQGVHCIVYKVRGKYKVYTV